MSQDLLEMMVPRESPVPMAIRVLLVRLVLKEIKVPLVMMATEAQKVKRDLLASPVRTELWESLVMPVQLVMTVLLERMALTESLVSTDLRVPPVRTELSTSRENLVMPDLRDLKVSAYLRLGFTFYFEFFFLMKESSGWK